MSDVLRTFLMDFTVNVFESIAGFSLILSLFRFSFNKNNFINTIIASVVLAITSYLLRFPLEEPTITSFFMLAWIIIFLWRLFRIHIFYSALMAVTGYMTYITIQDVVVMVASAIYGLDRLFGNFMFLKAIQIIASVVSLLSYFCLTRKRIGFTFVPDRTDMRVVFDRVHLMLLFITIASAVVICFISFVAVYATYLFPLLTATFLVLLHYLNYSYENMKREKSV